MPADRLFLGDFVACTEALGPGKRAGVWVRGCSLTCPGCTTPQFIPKGRAEHETAVATLVERIREARVAHGLEGVSFSGGEPFEQAEALAALARICRGSGLTVISWSGYSLEELQASTRPGVGDLLSAIDVLIDGRYVREQRASLPMRGSSNQRIHFMSDAYDTEDFMSSDVEFRIEPDGSAKTIGILDDRAMSAALRLLGVE